MDSAVINMKGTCFASCVYVLWRICFVRIFLFWYTIFLDITDRCCHHHHRGSPLGKFPVTNTDDFSVFVSSYVLLALCCITTYSHLSLYWSTWRVGSPFSSNTAFAICSMFILKLLSIPFLSFDSFHAIQSMSNCLCTNFVIQIPSQLKLLRKVSLNKDSVLSLSHIFVCCIDLAVFV